MNEAEKKARELYPIEDFPFREDAEFQEEKQQAYIKGANWQAQVRGCPFGRKGYAGPLDRVY